jgi:hypothetical protein
MAYRIKPYAVQFVEFYERHLDMLDIMMDRCLDLEYDLSVTRATFPSEKARHAFIDATIRAFMDSAMDVFDLGREAGEEEVTACPSDYDLIHVDDIGDYVADMRAECRNY